LSAGIEFARVLDFADGCLRATEDLGRNQRFALSRIDKPIRHDSVADYLVDRSPGGSNDIDLDRRQLSGGRRDFVRRSAGGPRTEIRDVTEKYDRRTFLNRTFAVVRRKLDDAEGIAVGEPPQQRFAFVNGLSWCCRWSQVGGTAQMIVDVRIYTLIPRKQAKYLELFEKRALPVTKRHGLELMSYYVSYIGALNQVVHLWGYENLADMEKKRAARDADPAWGEFLSLTEGMLLVQEDKVMRCRE
jgi:hypothetical protein